MDRAYLHFARGRTICFKDFATLKGLLKARGYDVAALNRHGGGIAFLANGKDVGKDIRFRNYHQRHELPRAVDGEFSGDLSKIWIKAIQPIWDDDNRFYVDTRGDFTPQELLNIRADIVTALGAVENVIATENRGILPSDSVEVIRLFLGFDRDEAIKKWTIPHPEWSEESERLFKCWKCMTPLPTYYFDLGSTGGSSRYQNMTDMETLLWRYEVYGHISWCNNCQTSYGRCMRATKKLRCD